MQVGAKTIETRGRLTHVRGELAICATKTFRGGFDIPTGMAMLAALKSFVPKGEPPIVNKWDLPYGVVVCVVELYGCLPVERALYDPEEHFGDYSKGRFAWLTRNCRRLKTPVPVTGHQGFFNLPPDVEAKVRAQL